MAKITKRTVDALTPKQRPFTVYDDALPGFGVKVQPTRRTISASLTLRLSPLGPVPPFATRMASRRVSAEYPASRVGSAMDGLVIACGMGQRAPLRRGSGGRATAR